MRAILILIATVAFFVAPAITPPFTGYDPGMFPVAVPRPAIQPAGYAFGIWGVIYTWLAVSAVFGLIWRRDDAGWQATRLPHLAALVLGSGWLAIAGSYPLTATAAIIAMWAAALMAFLAAPVAQDRWWLQAPLGLFAGWLTAASGVSSGVILAGYGWLDNTWAALTILTIVLAVAITVQMRRPAMPLYATSVIWAAIGIAVVNWQDITLVAYAAVLGAVVLTVLSLWRAALTQGQMQRV